MQSGKKERISAGTGKGRRKKQRAVANQNVTIGKTAPPTLNFEWALSGYSGLVRLLQGQPRAYEGEGRRLSGESFSALQRVVAAITGDNPLSLALSPGTAAVGRQSAKSVGAEFLSSRSPRVPAGGCDSPQGRGTVLGLGLAIYA